MTSEEVQAAFLNHHDVLSGRERLVIRCRFVDSMTLLKISQTLGLSRERVRQIECEAVEKLRRVVA